MKIISLMYCLLLSLCSYADGPAFSGNMTPVAGSTETYTIVWEQWDNTYEYYANVDWTVNEGTVLSSTKNSVTIQWNGPQGFLDVTGSITVSEDLGGQNGGVTVLLENTESSTSELCNGILGPPSVAINFGSGANPGSALPSGTTTYQYATNCALNVGEYTIRSNSTSCRGLWYNIPQDHTGNPNGYFLMLNANQNQNEVYRTTVTGLNAAFRYEFSAWVGNLYINNSGQDPNIRFQLYDLNGNIIASSGTIAIGVTTPTFQWQRVGFMFDIPSGVTSLQVVIVNTRSNTANEGNDMVVDDISFAPCYPPIIASFSNSSIVEKAYTCNNGTVNLYASWPSTIPFTNPAYQWQRSVDNGNTWTNISGATSISAVRIESSGGIYQYRMYSFETANPTQFVVSNILTYFVQVMVVDPHTTKLFSCNGAVASDQIPGFFHFQYSDPTQAASLNYTFAWSPSTYISNPNTLPTYGIFPAAPTPPPGGSAPAPTNYNYTLTVNNTEYGCSGSNTQIVSVISPRKVGVASAFAPPTAPPNNVLVPINIEDQPGSEFWVWNRWGNLVFHSTGPTKLAYTWNGTYQGSPQPMDVYVWAVYLSGCPGFIYSGSHGDGISHGDVTLLR